MKKFITLGLITLGIFGLSYTAKAQGKIGYISQDEIIVSMPEAARIDTQLNTYQHGLLCRVVMDKSLACGCRVMVKPFDLTIFHLQSLG